MAKNPPRANRRVNGDVSVDLPNFLEKLSRALDWKGDTSLLGKPGAYGPGRRACNAADRAVDYLFEEIMSKFDDESNESNDEKTERSLAKFREAEALCAKSNNFFALACSSDAALPLPDCDPDVWEALCLSRRRIAALLGKFDWNEVASGFRFTYGASFGMPRTRSTPAHKYSGKLEITNSAESLAQAALQLNPAWGVRSDGEPGYNFVPGNRLICVPKNYKVHRLIAAEPSGNLYFQKGIGSALRRRLQAVGINLRDQSQNQDWSRFGSVTGLVATVDMSMASDTVSKGIVEFAIPPDWVEAMSLCRSPVGVLPSGEQVLYRKWSSMGNAYTFETETVIFYGLAWACTRLSGHDTRFIAVYGDDVVLPSGACDLFFRVLRQAGFVPNEKKSFVSGPFRESCGKHYYRGIDVSPFYIRRQPKVLTELFLLVNNLERWRRRLFGTLTECQDESLKRLVKMMRSIAPSNWRRPRIPDNYGDGAFIGTFDECLPRRPFGKWLWWEGWQVEVIADVRKRIARSSDASLTLNGVTRAMLESLELGNLQVDDGCDYWYEDLHDRSGGVLPNRSRRYITTTLIVAQY